MSDYFCNIYNFRNLALSRQKQAPVQTLSAFNNCFIIPHKHSFFKRYYKIFINFFKIKSAKAVRLLNHRSRATHLLQEVNLFCNALDL